MQLPSEFINISAHIPPFLWNLILAGLAIIAGILVQKILSLILRVLFRSNEATSTRQILTRRLRLPLNYFLPLVMLESVLPFMYLNALYTRYIDKLIQILLILAFGFIMIRMVLLFEDYINVHFDINKPDNLKERKVRTQIHFIRKLLILIIVLLTVAAVLLSFESLRKLGAGLVTGVGVGGIIVGFAAQKSLGNLLAGFQIALTQSIRIDDVLVVEGEWGRVEDITLTYVVLRIWDERRLILPITYFIEKPFQNWTRIGSEITGTVFIQMDYSLPMEPLRKEFHRLLEINPLWDGRIKAMQVTDAKEHTMEIRALMSARNSSDAFDLRCIIREKLIGFIQEHYPESLPQYKLRKDSQVGIGSSDLVNRTNESSGT